MKKQVIRSWRGKEELETDSIEIIGPLAAIHGSDDHSMIVRHRDGKAFGCGYLYDGVRDLPKANFPISNVDQIAVGPRHVALLMNDGTLQFFGSNDSGQSDPPADIQGEILQVCTGDLHTMALLRSGQVRCWGADETCNPPTDLCSVQSIAMGTYHGVAICEGGIVRAWGANTFGQCDVPNLKNVIQVAGGHYHSVALEADGSVVCWGGNMHGQCNVPQNLAYVKQIAAGYWSTAALLEDGQLIAWGLDGRDDPITPPDDLGLVTFVSITGSQFNVITFE